MKDLAEELLLSHHGAVQMVNRLCSAGLAERIPSHLDRRSVFLKLTTSGDATVKELASQHLAEMQRHEPLLAKSLRRLRNSARQPLVTPAQRAPIAWCAGPALVIQSAPRSPQIGLPEGSGDPLHLGGRRDIRGHRVELAAEVRADSGHGRDDHDRDQGYDQAVLDGRRARFVPRQALDELVHFLSHSNAVGGQRPSAPAR